MKKYLLVLPELLIITISILWFLENYMASGCINYFAILAFVLLILQLFIKNKVFGIFLGSVFFLFGLYLILAVLSEFKKFTVINSSALQLICIGLLFSFVLITSSIGMFYKSVQKAF